MKNAAKLQKINDLCKFFSKKLKFPVIFFTVFPKFPVIFLCVFPKSPAIFELLLYRSNYDAAL